MPSKKTADLEVTADAALMLPCIESRILTLRNQRVIVDADLASLYGVDTKRLNEQVKRNSERFPQDFMFQLDTVEKAEVVANCDHLNKLKFSKVLPFAFTEYGAIQAANVLNSTRAVEMGIFVVRAFVRLKQASAANAELTKRLDELEQSTERLAISHDTFSRNTRIQLKQLFDALRELATNTQAAHRLYHSGG
jgi:ORF6N domain